MENLTFDNKARRMIKECPCGRSNKDGKFCPYKGYTDKGYCHSCGQTFFPKTQTSEKNDTWRQSDAWQRPMTPPSVIEPSLIDIATVRQTIQRYDENNFMQFLKAYFQNDIAVLNDLIQRFSIGTAKGNKTIFWQRDINGHFRTGQIMLYNPTTGKRNQDLNPTWIHSVLRLPNFQLTQCFFGEQQLVNDSKIVAIVEAAKTAAIMTVIEPRYTWIATGGATQLKTEKCEILKGRSIVLYPDLGIEKRTNKSYFEMWTNRAEELKQDLNLEIRVSDILEKFVATLPDDEKAEHIKNGFDIADYAIKLDWFNRKRKQKVKTLPLSKDEQIIQNMVKAQPLIKELITRLSLVNAQTGKPFQNI